MLATRRGADGACRGPCLVMVVRCPAAHRGVATPPTDPIHADREMPRDRARVGGRSGERRGGRGGGRIGSRSGRVIGGMG